MYVCPTVPKSALKQCCILTSFLRTQLRSTSAREHKFSPIMHSLMAVSPCCLFGSQCFGSQGNKTKPTPPVPLLYAPSPCYYETEDLALLELHLSIPFPLPSPQNFPTYLLNLCPL